MRKMSKAASACISQQIKKHCHKKRGRGCKDAKKRSQAIAIAFSQCQRKGFRSIPRRA